MDTDGKFVPEGAFQLQTFALVVSTQPLHSLALKLVVCDFHGFQRVRSNQLANVTR